MIDERTVAYFSMEIGLTAEIPTYSGGLGVLAGDTIRAAADLGVPMVAVTLIHRKGYFRQSLDSFGEQREEPVNWVVEDFLEEETPRVSVMIEGRKVTIRAWRHDVVGIHGFTVPVYYLGAKTEDNTEWDAGITDHLYGGNPHYRLCQEVLLGIGGVRMLRALGYDCLQRFHLNEGHAALAALELLEEQARDLGHSAFSDADAETVRRKCVFTTHTPVPAGHDRFKHDLVESVMDPRQIEVLKRTGCLNDELNMTHLALRMSGYVNGVAHRHGEVSRQMFPEHTIDALTNGVHVGAWTTPSIQSLFDRYMQQWRGDGLALRQALRIPLHELWTAHMQAKRKLIDYVNRATNVGMDVDVFTIGFARRVALYKRADMLFTDIDRLRRIAKRSAGVQLIFAGKAHPHDVRAKELIRHIFQAAAQLKKEILVCYLPDYDIDIGALMTAGVDLWLNNPEPPLEASGTSGMKAALNGVPSLSVLDGWWIEGWIEGVTGWSIGQPEDEQLIAQDRGWTAREIYDKLEYVILPMYYQNREAYQRIMRQCIAINGAYFNTHRMMQQYVMRAYMGRYASIGPRSPRTVACQGAAAKR